MPEDLKKFINFCYERSGIEKENIFHHRMFKILFKFKDKMTENELKQELKKIGIESKDRIFDSSLH